MGPRAGLSSVLILGAVVLVIAIAIGNSMGNRVLGQVAGRAPALTATQPPSAAPSGAEDGARQVLWKRRHVLSVATDPAFPDPRITPEPPPEPTARPHRASAFQPKAVPSASPSPSPSPAQNSTYTSPPLLIPMKSHAHDEPASPEPADTSPGLATASPPGRPAGRAANAPGPLATSPTAP